jgi:2-polyprenyl-6-hydroxyphenyl methylase/3-demethylubiquinone-9 3-methyltransferase
MTVSAANVDQAEIKKFEDLASRWWDPESEFKPLHEINPLRLEYINKMTALAGKTVLDVGCGGGILAESMAAKGAVVTGLDMGEAPLKVAELHLLESGLEVDYIRLPVEQLAEQKPASFDVVTCMEMLEHVPDPSSVIHACATLVKPGGHLFFSTLNRNPKSYLFAIVGAEYLLKLLPKGTHDFSKFIRPSEMGEWIRQTDLELQDMIGLVYNPITKVYKLGSDISVNYMMSCIRSAD